ncbi:4'-phosphopantetheinyl transferase superfamily protein [Nocardioides sp. SYSU D00038]|uniref:4'-phosphopantetheinyl transferase family protein n=1 Tax=Nocardioides sp. SYSU D00038 TaxID=2812554 RepID=UPI0019670CE2|nr:hypothetical protein [Nocardioides sp. SYSU D00038]
MSSRADRVALRPVLHRLLVDELGVRTVARLCPRCGGSDHGRPVVPGRPDLHLSLTYAGGLAAVAWSTTGPVGIDVEPGADLAWTRREALLKAAGTGFGGSGSSAEPALATVTLPLPEGYVGTVAGVDVSWRLAGPAAP